MSISSSAKLLLGLFVLGLSLQAEYDSSWSKKFIAESKLVFIVEVDHFREDESVHFKLIKQIKGKNYVKNLSSILQVCCGVKLKPYSHGLRPEQHYLIVLNEKNIKEQFVGDMNMMLIQTHQKKKAIYNKFDHQKFEWRTLDELLKQFSHNTKKGKKHATTTRGLR